MKLTLIAASLILALSSAQTFAQSANDVGLPAHGSGPSLGLSPEGTPGGLCPPATGLTTSFSGSNTQLGRIFRDEIASTCPSKAYPGIFNAATTYNFEAFTYRNTSGAAACVTVNFDPDAGATPCGVNAHASAYIGSYNPADQATNFVGDVGSSVAQPFSFEVPASSDLVIAVTNTQSAAACTFAFQVVELPCVEASTAVPAPVNNPMALILLGFALFGVGAFAVSRRV